MSSSRGVSVHITIARLTEDKLRSEVAAHLHQIPHGRVVTFFCDSATGDAKRLAAAHNWRTHKGEALVIIIRERGV